MLTEMALAQQNLRRNKAWVLKCGDRMKTWKFTSLPNGRQRSGSDYGNSSRKWGRGEWDCGKSEFSLEDLTLKAEVSEHHSASQMRLVRLSCCFIILFLHVCVST